MGAGLRKIIGYVRLRIRTHARHTELQLLQRCVGDKHQIVVCLPNKCPARVSVAVFVWELEIAIPAIPVSVIQIEDSM